MEYSVFFFRAARVIDCKKNIFLSSSLLAKNFTEHYSLLSLQSSNRPGSAASSEGKQSKNVSFDEDVTVFEGEKDEVPEEEQTQNHEESTVDNEEEVPDETEESAATADEEENEDGIDAEETVRSPEPDDSSSSSSSSSSESESSDSEDEEKSGRKGTDHFPKISKVHLKLYDGRAIILRTILELYLTI